jgi:hypothetical protein
LSQQRLIDQHFIYTIAKLLQPFFNMGVPAKFAYTHTENTERKILNNPHYKTPHCLGPCNITCSECKALHYIEEVTGPIPKSKSVLFLTCCQKDKVTLPYVNKGAPKFPLDLHALFMGSDDGKLTQTLSWVLWF